MLWLTLLAPPSVAHVARKSNKPGLSDWRHVIQSFMWFIENKLDSGLAPIAYAGLLSTMIAKAQNLFQFTGLMFMELDV
jgi:hypothetical protein